MKTAEIVAIGSELLTPSKTDTNSLWLTEYLNGIGIEVKLKTVVGDDEARLEDAIRDAIGRSDIVITTGGLGPTEDDITRTVSARAVGRQLQFRQDLLDQLRERFRSFGYEMPERNRRQAYVIEGAAVLPNPNGSAPGMLYQEDGKVLSVLPGPPRESRPMFVDHVLPVLRASAEGISVRRKRIMVSGLGESKLDELISPIYKEYDNPVTSILFSRTSIEVQLTATGTSADEADSLNEELSDRICGKLGTSVFSAEGKRMEEVVGELLSGRKMTVATAESCTGGLVAQRITEVPGASDYFYEGFITYSNEAKMSLLGVSGELLAKHGAVSAEVAEAMASGARESSGSNFGISTTGIAGPTGGTEDKPVGTVFVAVADENGPRSVRLNLPGDRTLVRWRASQAVLDLLRRHILSG